MEKIFLKKIPRCLRLGICLTQSQLALFCINYCQPFPACDKTGLVAKFYLSAWQHLFEVDGGGGCQNTERMVKELIVA
ncbi:MAG: hypothetical protein A2052_04085 [Deltaproteobacteria bacterium GWA2_54_12]|nr:MAG: hypothetical protein A2052_04085 [Deltaproteobacteria bacterium GWA2_54_12]